MTIFEEYGTDEEWNHVTNHKFNGVNVWVCSDSGTAYNLSQNLPISDNGSILYVPSENIVGVVNPWPISVTNNIGELHYPTNWKTIGNDKITKTPAYSYKLEDGTIVQAKPENDIRKGYKFKNAVQFAMKYESDHVNKEAVDVVLYLQK